MGSDVIRTGGCGCGYVRYRTHGEPIMVHNCHCRLCQQQTGSTSVVNVFIESDNFELVSGDLTEHILKSGSGKMHSVHRCAQCGCAVWSHYPGLGKLMTAFRAGTLDKPDGVTPDVVIFAKFKMSWVTLPDNIPSFPEYYDARTVLPPEEIERLRALGERRKAGDG